MQWIEAGSVPASPGASVSSPQKWEEGQRLDFTREFLISLLVPTDYVDESG